MFVVSETGRQAEASVGKARCYQCIE